MQNRALQPCVIVEPLCNFAVIWWNPHLKNTNHILSIFHLNFINFRANLEVTRYAFSTNIISHSMSHPCSTWFVEPSMKEFLAIYFQFYGCCVTSYLRHESLTSDHVASIFLVVHARVSFLQRGTYNMTIQTSFITIETMIS